MCRSENPFAIGKTEKVRYLVPEILSKWISDFRLFILNFFGASLLVLRQFLPYSMFRALGTVGTVLRTGNLKYRYTVFM